MRYAATIIADASFCDNCRACGYAYWVASHRKRFGGEGRMINNVDSNNSGELLALMRGLHDAITRQVLRIGDAVLLQTDCAAAIDAIEGIRDSANFTPQEHRLVNWLARKTIQYELIIHTRHVKGHTKRGKHPESRYAANRMCDRLAKKQLLKARAELARDRFFREVDLYER